MKSAALRVMGVMTGTSCDGLDAACVEFRRDGWTPLWFASKPFPSELKKRVLAYQKPREATPIRAWMELDRDLGEWYGEVLHKICSSRKIKPELIANHGQTLAHFPEKNRQGVTLQLGDPSRIARTTGITVISHFRQGDVAAGGEGAPLAPLFHGLLIAGTGKGASSIHNLGGISNLTYLKPDGKLLAFDSGPGNIWIDAATALTSKGKLVFDKGGVLASRGEPDTRAVSRVLNHPFFKKAPPKSTGRDEFTFEFFRSKTRAKGCDLIATATEVTAVSIARSYEKWILRKNLPLGNIHVCGGGAKNSFLLSRIQNLLGSVSLTPIAVTPIDKAGFDSQAIEAQAFAYFGFLSLLGASVGGSWTGAKGFAPPGWITPGENWLALTEKIGTI